MKNQHEEKRGDILEIVKEFTLIKKKKNFIQSIECVTYSHPLNAITYYLLMSQNNSSADALLKGCLELFLDKISGHLRDKIFKFQAKKQKLCY